MRTLKTLVIVNNVKQSSGRRIMCDACGGICEIFDRMVSDFLKINDLQSHRRFFHPMEGDGQKSGNDTTSLSELVAKADSIGMTAEQLEAELCERTGFGEAVRDWISEKRIPNGMVRKIILTNAEKIIREGGAVPKLTLLQAA